MNNQAESITYKKPETNKPNFALRRALAIGGIGLVGLGVVKSAEFAKSTYEDLTNETIVATEIISIPQNGNVIISAQEAVKELASENGIDYTKIPLDQIIYQSQSAVDKSDGITRPGDQFAVTISEVSTGYKVSVDPVSLPTLEK